MLDSKAIGISMASKPQFIVLQKIDPSIQLNRSIVGQYNICFRKGNTILLGTTNVPTPFGEIIFYIVLANTPFLLCINNIDMMKIQFNNLKNVLVQGNKVVLVMCKQGYLQMLLYHQEQSVAWSNLTKTKIHQIYCCFGHPSVKQLAKVLQRSRHEFETKIIKYITKYYHQCQMNSKSPSQFKFTLKKDYNFNYKIVVDIIYIKGKALLHIVNIATTFQATR